MNGRGRADYSRLPPLIPPLRPTNGPISASTCQSTLLSLSFTLHLSPLYFSRLFVNYPSIYRVATSRLVSASFHFPMERFFIATRATFPLRGTVFTNNRLERGRSNGLASWRLRSVVVGGTKTVSARRPLSWSC